MTTGTLRIAVLGATGALGGHLVGQALARGHTVVALVRDPGRLPVPASPTLTVVTADVHRPESIVDGLDDADAVVSGLGNAAGDVGTLTAGARALALAREHDPALRLVWIGALGSGESAGA